MFGHNDIVGKGLFADSPEAQQGKLLVTSIFTTIQGEGPFAGRPAVFMRLAKCNLACSFCDTFFDTGDWMTADEIIKAARASIEAAGAAAVSLMVITGGEPMLQQAAVRNFITAASWLFDDFQIETNGIIPAIDMPNGTCVVVSPKCIEKDGRGRYLTPSAKTLAAADYLKFVISASPGSAYYSVPQWADAWAEARCGPALPVFVSPMADYLRTPDEAGHVYAERARAPTLEERSGSAEIASVWEPGLLDLERCAANHARAATLAMQRGYRLTLQMQLFAALP